MKPIPTLSLLLQLLIAGAARAGVDQVWVIGGGPDVLNSQVQIERNVLWVLRAMEGLPGKRRARVFFTDGDAPTPDIHEWSPPPESAAALQPLARVFDSYWYNGLRFRNHRIPQIAGSTEAADLVQSLGPQLRALQPGERGWLFFIGHGTYREDLNNHIELWNNTGLTVRALKTLLDQAPRQNRLRFLFTQCFSGAFADLAAHGLDRCGFLAEAADQESEGCSAAIKREDYEDYSTYFFAALSGRPRNGAGLNGILDRDADGRVTPLEAHFHVLATAYSDDIPRATSEVLLLQWQPWNLTGLLEEVAEEENEYSALARDVMGKAGIDPAPDPQPEIEQRELRLKAQWERLEQDQLQLQKEIILLQENLKSDLLRRWPRAGAAYTLDFMRFLEQELSAAQAFIQTHPDYPELQRLQERYWRQDDQALQLRRTRTQLEKIAHLLHLAQLKSALEHHGPDDLWERYRELRECESAPF